MLNFTGEQHAAPMSVLCLTQSGCGEMRYLIEFRHGKSDPYFVFPSNGSHEGLDEHAKMYDGIVLFRRFRSSGGSLSRRSYSKRDTNC